MATVLQEYRNIVLGRRPNARLTIVKDEAGLRQYRVVDGDTVIGDVEVDKMIAWREASNLLSRGDYP